MKQRAKKFFIFTVNILIILSFKSVFAQDFFSLSLDELLDVKITTASKKAETIYEAHSIASVITREELLNTGARTLTDAMQLIPGLEGTRGILIGLHDGISIRGRMTDACEDVLMLVNGQRINDIYSGGGLQQLKYMPIDNIKQIEIIRGPGSALYGSNAFTGIINIKTFGTEDVNESASTNIDIFGGSFDAYGASVRTGKAISDNFKITGYARYAEDDGDEYTYSEGYLRLPNGNYEIDDPTESLDLNFQAKYLDLTFDIDYSTRENHGYLPSGLLNPSYDVAEIDDSLNESEVLRAQLKYEWKVSDSLLITPSVRYLQGHLDAYYYLTSPQTIPYIPLLQPLARSSAARYGWIGETEYETSNFEVELQFNYDLENHSFVGGIYYQEEELSDPESSYNVYPAVLLPVGTPYPAILDSGASLTTYSGDYAFLPEFDRDVLSFYLQDTWKITDSVDWLLGFRYDDYSDFGSTSNPRTAVVYKIAEKMNLKFLYGSAFRAPTGHELYIRLNPVENGTADLDPQTIDTYEINFNYSPIKEVQTSLTFFYTEYKDLIEIVQDPVSKLYVRANANGKEKDTGFEFEIKYQTSKYKYLSANFAYINPENDDGDQRYNIAKTKSGIIFNYDVLENKLIFNSSIFFRGDRENNPLVEPIDDTWIFNTNIRVLNLLGHEGLEWSLGVSNLTDEDFYTAGASSRITPENLQHRGLQILTHIKMKL